MYYQDMIHKNHELNESYQMPQSWAGFTVANDICTKLLSSRDFCRTA